MLVEARHVRAEELVHVGSRRRWGDIWLGFCMELWEMIEGATERVYNLH